MFTGIVSCSAPILRVQKRNSVIEIALSSCFSDVRPGDSVAVDGVCLTVEKIDSSEMIFALAPDTLKTTGWGLVDLEKKLVNLELSLKVGSSLGGHFVTGHVDGMAVVQESRQQMETANIVLKLPLEFKPFLWKKGYLTVNGVSLTVQELLGESVVRLGLVPETLKRTNLSQLKAGDFVTFEVCYLARSAFNHSSHKT